MEYREYRADVAEEGGKLSGVAAPFGSETVIGDLSRGGFREEIAPGAFKKALRESDTVLLCDHDMSKPLARVSAGTLRLRETGKALEFDADPADTSYGRDLQVNVRAGNKGGMSIGFVPVKDDWYDDDGNPSNRLQGTRRVLREAKLPEVSCVTNPAYKDTAVFARDESAALIEERAAAVSTADRKSLAKKGHALPDGSYPIPDIAHLHAAAILAASHHGDWQAAKELIRKRAPQLGVDVNSLPGFGDKDGDADSGKRCESCGSEECPVALADQRDDPDGKEYAAIDTALNALRKTPPDVKGALSILQNTWGRGMRDDPDGREYAAIDRAIRLLQEAPPDVKGAKDVLSGNQMMRRDKDQEPDTSTPDTEDDDLALRMTMRSREIELEL